MIHWTKLFGTPKGSLQKTYSGVSVKYHLSGHLAFLLLLIPVIFLFSCGTGTETIVVGERARALEAEEEEEEITEEVDLRVLKIGEINRIHSFDPLFAFNNATKRMIVLTYEGLVRFNDNDEIEPAAAENWEISDDSLTYTFRLREDLYFHDDESFTQGLGRRVNSNDVVRLFERMASRDVPSDAAELFMNSIIGFEGYYLEQRDIYFERDRRIREIEGIEVIDNRTLAFHLNEPDRYFLGKLASPYAVIYPNEPFRFRDDGLHRRPVGTGPFQYESAVGDSLYVFRRNTDYYRTDEQGRQLPRIQRLEILNVTSETRLYTHFSRERLNLIMELGPQRVHSMVDESNQLYSNYRSRYRLEVLENPDPVTIRFNENNRYNLNRSDAVSVIRNVDPDSLRVNMGYPSLDITYREYVFTQANVGRVFRRFGEGQQHRLTFAFNQDLFPRILSGNIYQTIDDNLQKDLIQRRVFSRDILLYLDYLKTYIPGWTHERQANEIMRFEYDRYMLLDQNTEGVRTNSLCWWIDLNNVRVRDPDPL